MPTSNMPGRYFLNHSEVLGPAVLLLIAVLKQSKFLQ